MGLRNGFYGPSATLWFHSSGGTGDRSPKVAETCAACIDAFPFMEGRKDGERHTAPKRFVVMKHTHMHTLFFSPGTWLLLAGNFLHTIAEVTALFSVFS